MAHLPQSSSEDGPFFLYWPCALLSSSTIKKVNLVLSSQNARYVLATSLCEKEHQTQRTLLQASPLQDLLLWAGTQSTLVEGSGRRAMSSPCKQVHHLASIKLPRKGIFHRIRKAQGNLRQITYLLACSSKVGAQGWQLACSRVTTVQTRTLARSSGTGLRGSALACSSRT